jgi:hypothetical protein
VSVILWSPCWQIADPICTLIFACIVLVTTLTILRDQWKLLLGQSVYWKKYTSAMANGKILDRGQKKNTFEINSNIYALRTLKTSMNDFQAPSNCVQIQIWVFTSMRIRIRLFTLMQIRIRLFVFFMRTRILFFYADPDSVIHTSPDPLQSEKPWWASTASGFLFWSGSCFSLRCGSWYGYRKLCGSGFATLAAEASIEREHPAFINIFFWGGGDDGVFWSFLDPVQIRPVHNIKKTKSYSYWWA